jgi:hypothetical protein
MDKLALVSDILGSLFKAGTAVYDVIKASNEAAERDALAALDAALADAAPQAAGLRAMIDANRAAALQALHDKFNSNQP